MWCGGLPLGLRMNSTRGKNSLLWRGVLVLGGCEDDLNPLPPTMVASPIYRGPGPLPKY